MAPITHNETSYRLSLVTMTGMPQQTMCWVVFLPLFAELKLILGPTGSNPSISYKQVDLELMFSLYQPEGGWENSETARQPSCIICREKQRKPHGQP